MEGQVRFGNKKPEKTRKQRVVYQNFSRLCQSTAMIDRLCPDQFITPERVRMTAWLMLAATLIGLAYLFATAHGTVDSLGRPLGTDFSNVWTAGWMADQGQAAQAWNWPVHYEVQKAIHHNPAIPFYGWHYPPPFLILATLLAQIPYVPALILWQGLTLGGALMVIRHVLPDQRDALLIALGAPVVMVCLGHGQNAFMTAGLLGGGMALLDRRPWIAGMLLGALVYKPQFAVLIPVLIIARGNARAFLAAGLTSAGLCLLTLLAGVHRFSAPDAAYHHRKWCHRLGKDPKPLCRHSPMGRQHSSRLCGAGPGDSHRHRHRRAGRPPWDDGSAGRRCAQRRPALHTLCARL